MQEAFTLAFGVHCQDFDDVCAFARILTASFMLLWTCSQAVTGDRRRTFRPVGNEKRGEGRGESSLLERVVTAAEERHLSQNTLTAYRCTGLKLIAWSAAEGLVHQTKEAVGQGNS